MWIKCPNTPCGFYLLSLFFFPQSILFGGSDVPERDVVNSAVVKHHQCVRLLRVHTRALPEQKRAVLKSNQTERHITSQIEIDWYLYIYAFLCFLKVFYQLMHSLEIEPVNLALQAPCTTILAMRQQPVIIWWCKAGVGNLFWPKGFFLSG